MSFNKFPAGVIDKKLMADCLKKEEKNYKDINFIELEKDYNDILFILTQLVNLIHEKQIPVKEWIKPSEILLLKLASHSGSVKQVATPVPIYRSGSNLIAIRDVPSVYVLSRAQLECYLTLHYFIFSPQNDGEGKFKQLLYKLSGLSNRQSYLSTLPENLERKEEEARIIAELLLEIETNEYYQALSVDLQKKVKKRNPPARLIGWEDLIRSSRLKDEIFLSSWKLFSNHAHSEFIGTMQFQDYLVDSMATNKMVYHVLQLNLMILCVTIIELLNLFPELIPDYVSSVSIEVRTTVQFLSKFAFKE
ncbi:hypothetical protein [Chitinophaga arvensicola]|uniref:Uncharacterized protein n=1 Tax=Chitinophaga arvensicola TaxID=29529 RepID=A0A1I0SE47_9BACT|nr:hypothetical protein [Chitinophaga arvensicola]SEW57467.1 hypothetical protein SAMN04488122_6797 [Chitinophaga arvensicola]